MNRNVRACDVRPGLPIRVLTRRRVELITIISRLEVDIERYEETKDEEEIGFIQTTMRRVGHDWRIRAGIALKVNKRLLARADRIIEDTARAESIHRDRVEELVRHAYSMGHKDSARGVRLSKQAIEEHAHNIIGRELPD